MTTHIRDLDASTRSGLASEWWSLAIAVVVTVSIGLMLSHEPDRVTVTIANQTEHRLDIHASTPDEPGLSFVTIVGPGATKSVPGVVDRGTVWVLHVRVPGMPAGTIEVSRADLTSGSLVIPPDIIVGPAPGVPSGTEDPDAP